MGGPGVVAEQGGVLGVAMEKFVSEGTLPAPRGSADVCELAGGRDVRLVVLGPLLKAALPGVVVCGEVSRGGSQDAECGSM